MELAEVTAWLEAFDQFWEPLVLTADRLEFRGGGVIIRERRALETGRLQLWAGCSSGPRVRSRLWSLAEPELNGRLT